MSNINQCILISAAVKVFGVLDQHTAFLGEKWRAQAFQNGPPARPNLVATGGRSHRLARDWPALVVLGLTRLLLLSRFPSTHDLVHDWYNHADDVALLPIGALLARQPGVWREMEAKRFTALGLALACRAAVTVYVALPDRVLAGKTGAWRVGLRTIQCVVYALCQWSATASFGIFDLVRRVPVLRACFGIASPPRTKLQQLRLVAS
jgi:hypothetical protein